MWDASRLAKDLQALYLPEHRYANFGNILLSIETHGIRGLDAEINCEFPITVIVGKNGSGKSTLAQLVLCCYRYAPPGAGAVQYDTKNYYSLGNFFIKSNLDPEPYTPDAYLKYTYATDPESKRPFQLTLFGESGQSCFSKENVIKKVNSDWGGYRKRPDRKCIYFGMGFFVPHHEMGNRIYLDPKTNIQAKRDFSPESLSLAARILGVPYQSMEVDTIVNQTKKAEMGFASRYGSTYSENHMGCGEGRLIRMVDAIEGAPEKSLIVIEEPETALHLESQHNLAIYLLDVCKRKRHQIVITTHAPSIIEVMPMCARKKIRRTSTGTEVEDNPSIQEILADLSNGHHKSFLVYVEDEFSKKLLIELIRRFKPKLLNATSVAVYLVRN